MFWDNLVLVFLALVILKKVKKSHLIIVFKYLGEFFFYIYYFKIYCIFHYINYFIISNDAQVCYCGSSNCRGYISKAPQSLSSSDDGDDVTEINFISKPETQKRKTNLKKRIISNDNNKLREVFFFFFYSFISLYIS